MRIAVAGLWHLGSVTAACLAAAGHDVVGLDEPARVNGLSAGRAPLLEPGLDELIAAGIAAGRLRFTASAREALAEAELLWVTYDTPVDEEDRADLEYVVKRVAPILRELPAKSAVLVSSQLPVGTVRKMRDAFRAANPDRDVLFAYSPENLRLGKAIVAFKEAERIVVGCESTAARERIEPVVRSLGIPAVWMGLESAEMVKHTINAFLATCVTFINEISTLCEWVGADAGEVEAGIRSEPRIGARAYVTPGAAFGGGTLARDVAFLNEIAATHRLVTPVIGGVIASNRLHAGWAFRRLQKIFDSGDGNALQNRHIAVLGLTYKPGTNTLRRSTSIELCCRLREAGAEVRAFDPAIRDLPVNLAAIISLAKTAADAVVNADAVVVATEWPEFREIQAQKLVDTMRGRFVIDAGGFLARSLGASSILSYVRVGSPG